MASSASEKIAIVIPAYKGEFLRQTLRCIAGQTCRDFTVYVGDDCSKYDIKSIVDEFSSDMDIKYVRFDTNLGGSDLVAQWERCIALTSGEKWIWLFSDDDLMPSDGVERIKAAIAANPNAEFFRFPLQVVNEDGTVTSTGKAFDSASSTAEEYLLGYFNGLRSSSTCEYVFSRRLFDKLGMVHFPCAWCADIATWYSYASECGGLVNLPGAPASWRNVEGVNISCSEGLHAQKMAALVQFIKWLKEHHGLPFSRQLRKATANYVKTILSVSLHYNFSKTELSDLVTEFRPISKMRAHKIYCKYILKRKL